MIAAASALALLLIMFIFNWFSVDFGDDLGGMVDVDTGANAWTVFSFIDIVLLITSLAAIGLAVMAAQAQSPNLPVALSAIVTALGILSVLLILFRIIDPPGDIPEGSGASVSREIGVFLGLLAAAGIAYGGFEAMREEGTTLKGEGDRLQSRDRTGTGTTGTSTTGTGTTGTGTTDTGTTDTGTGTTGTGSSGTGGSRAGGPPPPQV